MGSGARVDPLTPTAVTSRQWWRFWSRWSGSAQKPAEADDVEGEGCEEDAWLEGSLVAQVDMAELLMHIMLRPSRNMQGEARDEDTLGLAGLQGLPHPHHDQVLQDHLSLNNDQRLDFVLCSIYWIKNDNLSRMVSSTSSWNCLWGNGLKRVKEPRCTTGS